MLRAFLYLTLFATGFLLGGVFPSYSVQYKQRVLAQYEQVDTDLAPFQEIADRYHKGSMAELIAHHLRSDDPTFYDEGLAIEKMVDSHRALGRTVAALEGPAFDQMVYLIKRGDVDVARATWEAYTPTLVTTEQALLFAVMAGLSFCAFTWFTATMLGLLFGQRA